MSFLPIYFTPAVLCALLVMLSVFPLKRKHTNDKKLIDKNIRIFCGIVGLCILAFITFHTLKASSLAFYSSPLVRSDNLHLPSLPLKDATTPTRAIMHYILIDESPSRRTIIRAKEFEIKMPQDEERTISVPFKIEEERIGYSVKIKKMESVPSGANVETPILIVEETIPDSFSVGNLRYEEGLFFIKDFTVKGKNPFSLLRFQATTYKLYCVVYFCNEGDALIPIELKDYIEGVSALQKKSLHKFSKSPYEINLDWNSDHKFSPAIVRFFSATNFAGVLLILASIGLALFFRSYPLSVIGTMLFSFFFAITLDGVILTENIKSMKNTSLSFETRYLAIESISATFFYRKTALKALEELSKKDDDALISSISKTVLEQMQPVIDKNYNPLQLPKIDSVLGDDSNE